MDGWMSENEYCCVLFFGAEGDILIARSVAQNFKEEGMAADY